MSEQFKDAVKKTLWKTSVYLVLGFIYVGVVRYFIPNEMYSTIFIIISLLCFFVVYVRTVMKGAGTDASCYTVMIEGDCEYDNNYGGEK